jgi:PAS domain S-box-containing protein
MQDISSLVTSYALGDFDKRLVVSDRMDKEDALISGLHMLGEVLKKVTISRDFFEVILDTINDMAVVLSPGGAIEFVNQVTNERLGYKKDGLLGKPVDTLCEPSGTSLWRRLRRERGPDGLARVWGLAFLGMDGEAIPVEITARPLPMRGISSVGSVLLVAQDVGPRLQAENRLLRAEIEGRELERRRVARDLHDGMGQRLTAALFLVGAALKEKDEESRLGKLQAVSELLTDMVMTIRSVCTDMESRTLEEAGLVAAIRELAERMTGAGVIRVLVEEGRGLPSLSKALELDLFRVVQEFMTNAVRHGQATRMQVRLRWVEDTYMLDLKENGKGFVVSQVRSGGTGISGMYGRVRSHEGSFELESRPGMGTEAKIRIPVKD